MQTIPGSILIEDEGFVVAAALELETGAEPKARREVERGLEVVAGPLELVREAASVVVDPGAVRTSTAVEVVTIVFVTTALFFCTVLVATTVVVRILV